MIFTNSQQDIEIFEEPYVKKVVLKISGGADSAIVGYMLAKYVSEENPDLVIVPMTTINRDKPYQQVYSRKVLKFLKKSFGITFGKHYINKNSSGQTYQDAQNILLRDVFSNENAQKVYSGITSNPPLKVMETFSHIGPNDRNGKSFLQKDPYFRRPLINIDKQGVAELYVSLDVHKTLFPLTRSCEALYPYDIDNHCNNCWWCEERFWGFGSYT